MGYASPQKCPPGQELRSSTISVSLTRRAPSRIVPPPPGIYCKAWANSYNEILGTSSEGLSAVPKVRVTISSGDMIMISGLSQVIFTPVTTPLVTTHSLVNLYAGTWTVGQDIGPGRYVATTTPGDSGNFSRGE